MTRGTTEDELLFGTDKREIMLLPYSDLRKTFSNVRSEVTVLSDYLQLSFTLFLLIFFVNFDKKTCCLTTTNETCSETGSLSVVCNK